MSTFVAIVLGTLLCGAAHGAPARHTTVAIVGDEFHINGTPTYAGREWRGHRIQGLLMNSRMVQGIFDDRNPQTVTNWAYPDTKQWDAERNTREFIAAMPEWRRHGLLAFTLNLQGGSPQGYSQNQPWHNSALEEDGSLRTDYLARLERILDRADELGMVVILGYFYFGQDQRLRDEAAVIRATDLATAWIHDHGYRHVLIEVNNECNVRYDHAILQPGRVHELIERVKRPRGNRRLLAGTSYGGGTIPKENVVRASDFLLLHGNGVSNPDRIADMVRQTRAGPGYRPMPILFNEDDHFDFDKPRNNFTAAVGEGASWGYFDFRMKDEGFDDGYQSVPVHWGLSSARKRGFFNLVQDITGTAGAGVAILGTNYNGWTNALVMGNSQVEAVIVPAIGRVMQFRFRGKEGVFWENRTLDGKPALEGDWKATDWVNLGGDKSWPAPEGDWSKFTGRKGWRPPPAFDGLPAEARIDGNDVVMVSPVDPYYGIRVTRRVQLEPGAPVMRIGTTYERVSGKPAKIGVWVITQLREPAGVFAILSASTKLSSGYVAISKDPPPDLKRSFFGTMFDLLRFTRDPKAAHKIGTDADRLLWVGDQFALSVDSPRVPGAEYPDQGSSVEIYTNPDPLKYVELETLGPLHEMKAGDGISATNTYTLFRRERDTANGDAFRDLLR